MSSRRKESPNLEGIGSKGLSFPNSDVYELLDELLAKKVIELPTSKHLIKSNKVDDPK